MVEDARAGCLAVWIIALPLLAATILFVVQPRAWAALSGKPDKARLTTTINEMWTAENGKEGTIIRALQRFIAVPNLSLAFTEGDAWAKETYRAMDILLAAAADLRKEWAGRCKTDDIIVKVYGGPDKPLHTETGRLRTPAIIMEIPAFAGKGQPAPSKDSLLLYGHMDKQPVGAGWSTDPRKGLIQDGKLYGRGGADDGYALFSALSSVLALRAQGISHNRCVILIESAEESSSDDLPYYLQLLREEYKNFSLIICIDSGCGDYERLWATSSLRGIVNGSLEVTVLRHGVHSGDASGVVPSSFRIIRQLISRLEDERTGVILPEELHVDIPKFYEAQAKEAAAILGDAVYSSFPFIDGKARPVSEDFTELMLNRYWRPELAVTGMEGLPEIRGAGNVMLPFTRVKLSLRLPPGVDSQQAGQFLKTLFESDPPYGAHVKYTVLEAGSGWVAPRPAPWLDTAANEASLAYFGKKLAYTGEGGTISFMHILGESFPNAQFFITGILGPGSNAHAADESLDLNAVRRVTMCIAHVIAEYRRVGATR